MVWLSWFGYLVHLFISFVARCHIWLSLFLLIYGFLSVLRGKKVFEKTASRVDEKRCLALGRVCPQTDRQLSLDWFTLRNGKNRTSGADFGRQ